MPAMWKIAVLAFASFAAAMPSSPDAEPRALFAIESKSILRDTLSNYELGY